MKRITLIVTVVLLGLTLSNQAMSQEASLKSIPETAVAAGKFKTLVTAVKAAGLLETLSGSGPFTVLAPTDEAFAKLPKGTVESLLKPENKEKLVAILKLHVAGGELTSDMAEPGAEFPTVGGTPLKVDVQGDKITVGSATVVTKDVSCSNGVIHIIDSVILPETPLDPKALAGKWTYTKAIKSGDTKSAKDLEGQFVEITPKAWTLGGPAKFVMEYKIDSSKKPNTIKFTITESPFGTGMSTGGVIKMEGGQLVVCYAAQGGDAPKKFGSEPDSGVHMFYLKKEK